MQSNENLYYYILYLPLAETYPYMNYMTQNSFDMFKGTKTWNMFELMNKVRCRNRYNRL